MENQNSDASQQKGQNSKSSQRLDNNPQSSQSAESGQASADSTGAENSDTPPDALDGPPDADSRQFMPPEIGNRRGQKRASASIVPVAVYKVESDGSLSVVPEVTSAAIASDVLEDATGELASAGDGFGTLPSIELHYLRTTTVNGDTFLAFADTSYTDSWKSLALMLVLVGLGTMVVFFVISLFYSKWALRPVREAWDSQRQFVADASHDLKTPLTVILANAAILLKHPDHLIASESQWIESTQVEAENMQGLVNEMLELAQVEDAQNRELVRNPIDLSDLLDGETLLFDSVALEQNCLFNCEIEEGITILGDEKQVTKMVATLIENAFKYVDEGGTVDITLRKTGKNAQIAIRNTGSTISEEDLPHIFDRFYRTDKARTSGAGGFGLGLAISREIAVQHGGDITCTSSEAQGTTFTVKLPVAG